MATRMAHRHLAEQRDPAPAAGKAQSGNELLSRLSADDRALLAQHLELVPIAAGQRLVERGIDAPFLYLPTDGVVAVNVGSSDQQVVVGLIGREGIVHPALALGIPSSAYTVQVLIAGHAYRIARGRFVEATGASPSLRRTCMLYREAQAIQSYYLALGRQQAMEKCLALWLLMFHDRVDGDHLMLIHDSMAALINVRRPTVTAALHLLEGRRLIAASRGVVHIIDRRGLEQHVNGIHDMCEQERQHLLAAC